MRFPYRPMDSTRWLTRRSPEEEHNASDGPHPLAPLEAGGWMELGVCQSPLFFLAVFSLQRNPSSPRFSIHHRSRADDGTHTHSLTCTHTARTPPPLPLLPTHPCPALPACLPFTRFVTLTRPLLFFHSWSALPATAPPSGSPPIHNHTPPTCPSVGRVPSSSTRPWHGGTCLLVRCLPRRCPPTDASPGPRRWPVTTSCRGGPPAEREEALHRPSHLRACVVHRRPSSSSVSSLVICSSSSPAVALRIYT
ncbi:hypothetical protein B0T11DRAFT_127479 [Plectosphaerella cucumerina]|uniref:Uncharacterized protein n=1 Tax=Plectosphaerella cucumerina TaxID=40658 RepID=A0A8K0T9K8_9PEZI|nr:hypothetical protein B0T11DRAFT_127479 [Plectosphaerella cucumerina]